RLHCGSFRPSYASAAMSATPISPPRERRAGTTARSSSSSVTQPQPSSPTTCTTSRRARSTSPASRTPRLQTPRSRHDRRGVRTPGSARERACGRRLPKQESRPRTVTQSLQVTRRKQWQTQNGTSRRSRASSRPSGPGDVEAFDELIVEDCVQHNPQAGNGLQAVKDVFAPVGPVDVEVHRVIAEGDLVAVHVNFKTWNMAGVDIYRLNDEGKIIEHWDVLQQPPKRGSSPASPPGPPSPRRSRSPAATSRPGRRSSFCSPTPASGTSRRRSLKRSGDDRGWRADGA